MNDSEIPDDPFEKVRIALLRYYNSQCIRHTGYVIALLIGLITVISTWKTSIVPQNALIVLEFVLFLALMYMGHRVFYWGHLASEVMYVSEDDLLEKERKRKIPMLILHKATARISQQKFPITARINTLIEEVYNIPKKLQEKRVFCTKCGTKNIEEAIYCKKCGKKIGEEPSS